jgi:NAD(P)-dependent dehydrogenase (short-subunit alcohol dehydrogenase family)
MDNVVLITGGTGYIGKQLVRAIATEERKVAFTYRKNSEAAVELEHELEKRGISALAIPCDLLEDVDFNALIEKVERRLGYLDACILSASLFPGNTGNMDRSLTREIFRINVESQYFLAEAVAERMRSNGKGKMIFMLDTAGERVFSSMLPYSISRAAGFAMVRGFAKAYAPEVQVNGISPGIVRVPDDLDSRKREEILRKIPAGRFGMADEIVKTALFLLNAPSYITGEVIGVDGGYGL